MDQQAGVLGCGTVILDQLAVAIQSSNHYVPDASSKASAEHRRHRRWLTGHRLAASLPLGSGRVVPWRHSCIGYPKSPHAHRSAGSCVQVGRLTGWPLGTRNMEEQKRPHPIVLALFVAFLVAFFGGGLLLFVNLFVRFLPEAAFAIIALIVAALSQREVGLSGPGDGSCDQPNSGNRPVGGPLPAATASDIPRAAGEVTEPAARKSDGDLSTVPNEKRRKQPGLGQSRSGRKEQGNQWFGTSPSASSARC